MTSSCRARAVAHFLQRRARLDGARAMAKRLLSAVAAAALAALIAVALRKSPPTRGHCARRQVREVSRLDSGASRHRPKHDRWRAARSAARRIRLVHRRRAREGAAMVHVPLTLMLTGARAPFRRLDHPAPSSAAIAEPDLAGILALALALLRERAAGQRLLLRALYRDHVHGDARVRGAGRRAQGQRPRGAPGATQHARRARRERGGAGARRGDARRAGVGARDGAVAGDPAHDAEARAKRRAASRTARTRSATRGGARTAISAPRSSR